jgi:hypothetical protein
VFLGFEYLSAARGSRHVSDPPLTAASVEPAMQHHIFNPSVTEFLVKLLQIQFSRFDMEQRTNNSVSTPPKPPITSPSPNPIYSALPKSLLRSTKDHSNAETPSWFTPHRRRILTRSYRSRNPPSVRGSVIRMGKSQSTSYNNMQ